ncbi:UMP kinase [Patescibacteria group bacterium]|nr:UMP kinase [Patescibacteria group bacterium]
MKKRIVIKTSGETMGNARSESNLDFKEIKSLAQSLKKLVNLGYQVSVVAGGGNIFRGRMIKGAEIDKTTADHMGMMATHINALALESMLNSIGQKSVVMSPFYVPKIVRPINYQKAIEHLEKKTVVIFAGGTGNPYFTTDTNMILRALEIQAEVVYKATNVLGVYDKNPLKYKNAKLYRTLTYDEALKKSLEVMDQTAFALARDNQVKITVFKYSPQNLIKAVTKNNIGTKISN